jgi:tRNA modification GTPase
MCPAVDTGVHDLPLAGRDDTIVALATAPGRSALAVIRLSGGRAHTIARTIAASWPAGASRTRLTAITDPRSGQLLDRSIVVYHDAPHSYTGEDLVEITSHGGGVVSSTIIAALIAQGARQALPGEFTRRAVLNGKIDVMQAEAISDLIDARSRRAQTAALAQLDGGLSRRISALRDALIGIEALIAYDIDFPEEDDGPVPSERILAACDETLGALEALRATAPVGELIREGAVVVLAGAPNVGKSSLFNALLGQTRAIVTEIPGTTRDALEAVIDVDGWALRLVDTAGLRETTDRIEQLGIEMSEQYMDRAALVLACGDSLDTCATAFVRVNKRTDVPIIAVHTKADLPENQALVTHGYQTDGLGSVDQPIAVSAETGVGLSVLLERITGALGTSLGIVPNDVPLLTRTRHRRAVEEAIHELRAFRTGWSDSGLPAPVVATHLRSAVLALEELIGTVDVEDVLDRVFSAFCVGK